MTLFFYIARRFVINLIRVQVGLLAVLLLMVSTDAFFFLSGRGAETSDYFQLIFFTLPDLMSATFSLVVLLGSMFTFLGLARSSELVIVRAAGISALKILMAPIVVTILIGALGIAVINPIVASTIRKTNDIRAEFSNTSTNQLSISRDGLWLRQINEDSNFLIQSRTTNSRGDVFHGVRFHEFSPNNTLVRRIEASRAILLSGEWKIINAKQWSYPENEQFDASHVQEFDELVFPTDLTSERILNSFAAPRTISVWDIPNFIAQLEASGFAAVKHKVFLQSQFATPLLLVSMMLIGAAFSLRHARFGHAGVMALTAVLSGFFLYALKSVAESLGQAQEVPILLATWALPAAATLLALTYILHLEDG